MNESWQEPHMILVRSLGKILIAMNESWQEPHMILGKILTLANA